MIWSEKRNIVLVRMHLRHALAVAVEESSVGLSTVDIADRDIVLMEYCNDFPTRPGVAEAEMSSRGLHIRL